MNLKVILMAICILCGGSTLLYLSFKERVRNSIHIHFILPIEHTALQDIVAGFQSSLSQRVSKRLYFIQHNAQGDPHLLRSILSQISKKQCDLVVPIGTSVTQMTLKMIKDKPILSLAAMYSEAERKGRLLTGVLDEITSEKLADFVEHFLGPSASVVLIHSTDDRRFKQASEMAFLFQTKKMNLKCLMVHNLTDLYTVSQSIPKETAAVLILKDNMIASGISVLKKICQDRGILLITSDEGTVKEGAPIGLGIIEKDIGKKGGEMAAHILKGRSIQSMPLSYLSDLHVFVQEDFLSKSADIEKRLKDMCHKKGYTLQIIPQKESHSK